MIKMADLFPHPGGETRETIGVTIRSGASILGGMLELHYELRANPGESLPGVFQDLPPLRVDRKSELWKEICFEAFLPARDRESYVEFNGAMNGDWDLYHFDSYRSGMRRVPCEVDASPRLLSREGGGSLFRIAFSLPESLFSGLGALGPIGLTTVLKTETGTTYWALNHKGMKPDFHLRSSFLYDPIRN